MFVGLLSPDGRVVEANRAALEAFGLRRDQVLGSRLDELPPWSVSGAVQQQLRDALDRAARGESSRYDFELIVGGRPVVVEFSLRPMRNASGEVTFIVPSAIDVTQRTRAEKASLASQARLSRILETDPSGVVFVDASGEIGFANPAAERIAGFSPGSLAGRAHTEAAQRLLTPEGRVLSHAGRPFAQVMRTGKPVTGVELVAERADGQQVVILVNCAPLYEPDGTLSGVVAAFSDITARRRAEETLRDNEERLRLALEAARMGIYDWDVRADRITWSRGHERLWAYAAGEFPGTYAAFSERVHPEDLPRIEAGIARSMAARDPFAAEFRVIWPDGSTHWVAGRGEFTFGSDGQPVRMRGVVVEVTERHLAEEALRQSQWRLRRALEQVHTAREEESRRIAQELHDELGQALTGLRIDLSWIEKHLPATPAAAAGPLRQKTREMMREIEETIRTVRRLSTELRPRLLDDLGLAAAIEWQAHEFEARTGILCIASTLIDDVVVEPKRATALFRILRESLTNVLRHAGASRVDIILMREAAWLLLRVLDDGRGIEPGQQESPGGLGILGMHERAQMFGGEVTVERARSGGTAVTVRMPFP
jgi:two-component system, NarL family, sensor histidine kinase UhpB